MKYVLLIVSFIIGIFFYSQIIFTIFYFLPKSIYSVFKKEIKPIAVLRVLITPIIYFVVLYFLHLVFENNYVLNRSVEIGSIFSIIYISYKGFLTKVGREDLNMDYHKVVKNYIIKPSKPSYEFWYTYGDELYSEGKYEEALHSFNMAYNERKTNATILAIGLCYANLKEENLALSMSALLILNDEPNAAGAIQAILNDQKD